MSPVRSACTPALLCSTAGPELVTGPFGGGDGLGVQLPGASRVHDTDGQQPQQQAEAEQEIVAEPAGALGGFLAQRKPLLGLAGGVVGGAQGAEGFDEQPVIAEPSGQVDRPFPQMPGRRQADVSRADRGSDQRPREQPGVRTGLRALQHRQQQADGFAVRERAIQ